jgi:hypothetical protein
MLGVLVQVRGEAGRVGPTFLLIGADTASSAVYAQRLIGGAHIPHQQLDPTQHAWWQNSLAKPP